LKPGKTDLDVGDGRIRYEREISALSAKTSRGQILANLYSVRVNAVWRSSGKDRSQQAEVVVYQP